jgi:hypothetical protein
MVIDSSLTRPSAPVCQRYRTLLRVCVQASLQTEAPMPDSTLGAHLPVLSFPYVRAYVRGESTALPVCHSQPLLAHAFVVAVVHWV